MQLSRTPDLGPWRRMLLAALATTLVAIAILTLRDPGALARSLGDTDDAMRLVLVRDLMAGRGWFDQHLMRLQPPVGVYMHWSRLIDGGLAALESLFRLGLSPAAAETATRFTWPLLWILPAVWAVLAVARRLAGGAAVFACAIIVAINMTLFLQFRPGRVDHHDVQIVMALLALAGAALETRRGALVAGLASGLGLAVGLEALIFQVIAGAYFALRYPLGEEDEGARLKTYALGLGLATVGFFLVQTPPNRWTIAACDAIAINLVMAIGVTSVGLVAAVALTRGRDWRARLAALALVGVVAAGAYVALDPNCLGGPFADVDPRLRTFWLPNVQEIRPIPRVWRADHETVWTLVAPFVLGGLAWLWLGRRPSGRNGFWWLMGACLAAGIAAGWSAIRMAVYANWFAVPLIAAAVVDVAERRFRGAMLATAVGACLFTPLLWGGAAAEIDNQVKAMIKPAPKAKAKPATKARARPVPRGDRCFRTAAYADLKRQPPGLVLSEIDLGPFILAHSGSSAMAAPYHRMNWGLVEARRVLSTPVDKAEAEARKLGVAYVLECPTHARNADRVGMAADSLQKRLDANRPPPWLEPLSTGGPLRLYRVRPATPAQ
jgi:hypothetical protein